ncbi:MAG: Beta-glucosidase [Marmoricola sp.]|nr:Beta-glucosidase [Marmoricola sp.]
MGENFPQLPAGFRFGTSTASYQIEGAWDEDGKGPSIWDTFTSVPGAITDGSTGAVACDHYHRHVEDVGLMERLGAGGYRFSISWPRVQPDGQGAVNAKGLDFYDRLVDELVAADIEPMATLYHWDLPQALQAPSSGGAAGWEARETAERFAEYAALCAGRLGDRVGKWIPVNEPNVVTLLGHAVGAHAPGRQLGFGALPVAHHLDLAHGLAVQALRANGAQAVGAANNHTPVRPASDANADVDAADLFDSLWNRMFAGPMLLGSYPEGFEEMLQGPVQEDLLTIKAPLDFYGVNYYNPMSIAAAPAGAEVPFEQREIPGYEKTDFGWPVVPAGLREVIGQLRERYPEIPPFYVTENGCSYGMGPNEHGVVDDQPRIDYLASHLGAVADAITDGADVRGYYCWSLLDNFEWAEGYTQRFGLVHVDYDTLVRTPKRSFDWYAELIRLTAESDR